MAGGQPYKKLQNKALHQGIQILYVSLEDITYTSNGHLMVRGEVTESECKALKDQYDRRSEGAMNIDEFFTPLLPLNETNLVTTSLNALEMDADVAGEYVASYQKIYISYVMAKYKVAEWFMATDNRLVAMDIEGDIVAIIAPYQGTERINDNESEESEEDE